MKRWILSLVVSCLTLSAEGAYGYNAGCDPCCGSFEAFGYALWLRPHSCAAKFVIQDPTYFQRFAAESRGDLLVAPFGKGVGSCADYDWGFRVGVGYVSCDGCYDVRVAYNRLETRDNARVGLDNGGVLWPVVAPSNLFMWSEVFPNGEGPVLTDPELGGTTDVLGTPALATKRTCFEWDAVDVEIAARLCSCRIFARGFIGLEWAELHQKNRHHYQGTTLNTNNSDQMGTSAFVDYTVTQRSWGVGPRVGFDVRYNLFCGIGITGRAAGGILAGEVRARDVGSALVVTRFADEGRDPETKETPFDVLYPSDCHLFPEFDVALGLSYEWCCGECLHLLGEVGYEMRTYTGAFDSAFFLDERTALAAQTCDPFHLQGIYFGLRLQY